MLAEGYAARMIPELPSGFVVTNAPEVRVRAPYRRGTQPPTTITFRRLEPRTIRFEIAGLVLLVGFVGLIAYEQHPAGRSSVIPLVFIAVLVLGLYAFARKRFGRVTVHADDDSLVLTEGTPPEAVFWGSPSRMAQIYRVAEWERGRIARQSGREKTDHPGTVLAPSAASYAVWVEMTDGTSQRLVSGLTTRDQAQYLEDVLEARLGIADRPVDGEMPKNRD